ncbi:hypothetical protein [Spiroplasma endosymbiont of Labia minor]|uniref:hypothetical protein n=1 Tax=Spiroplasma endosymbiont of Labia minor TaxID=3066305 RepID=UPI0030CD5BA5
MIIDTSKIRLWGKNPRYTNFENINFKEIGKEDFSIDSLKKTFTDNYENNKFNYFKNLFKNSKSIDRMLELIESISEGFNPNIDEILVTRSKFLTDNGISKNIMYVLEGNRRITCINLLLNYDNARNWLKENITEREYNKFKIVFDKFDNSINSNLEEIEVKYYDTINNLNDEIWKTLNTRHFGNRKGKMNWPRGLVLESIYKKVCEIRKDINLQNNSEMSDEDFLYMKKKLENFTGKTINTFDWKASLFINKVIAIYNKKNPNNIIIFSETNEEGAEKDDNVIDEKNSLNNDNLDSFFSVSSLELSMDTIKILDSFGNNISLSKYIDLNIDIKRWTITSNLENQIFEELLSYIVELIKLKKLNTRRLDLDYVNEIMALVSVVKVSDIPAVIGSNRKYVKYENISFNLLSKPYDEMIKKIEFSNDSRICEIQKNVLRKIYDGVIPTYQKILQRHQHGLLFLKEAKNQFEYALVNLWEIEITSLIKNNANNKIEEIPIIFFSALLRMTSEILFAWIIANNYSDRSEILESIREEIKKLNARNATYFKNKIINHLDETGESWKEHLTNLLLFEKKTCESKATYDSILLVHKQKNIVKEFINDIAIIDIDNNYENFINDVDEFLTWVNKNSNIGGKRDIMNEIIHKPHLIKKIHDNNNTEFDDFSEELLFWSEKILNFVDMIMNYRG